MWVNKQLFDMVTADNKTLSDRIGSVWNTCYAMQAKVDYASAQKAKDDLSIDWLRHRVNALEKQNAVLMMKATGIAMPVPEIVPNRPGTISELPEFATLPSFEDCGDTEAVRLGIKLADDGTLEYTK
jgi:hypothetical protein